MRNAWLQATIELLQLHLLDGLLSYIRWTGNYNRPLDGKNVVQDRFVGKNRSKLLQVDCHWNIQQMFWGTRWDLFTLITGGFESEDFHSLCRQGPWCNSRVNVSTLPRYYVKTVTKCTESAISWGIYSPLNITNSNDAFRPQHASSTCHVWHSPPRVTPHAL